MGLHKFKLTKEQRKLWFKNNKDKLIKIGTITMSVIVLVLGVVLFTMAKYKTNVDLDMINTKVGEFQTADVKVVAYNYDDTNHDVPPGKNDGYVIDSINCTNADGEWDYEKWALIVGNITGKVKCDISFKQQIMFTTYLRGLTGSNVVQDDGTTDKNMRFVGSSPNNYVNLPLSDGTTELFRVIGVFNENTHGQNENLVKIVRAESIGNTAWNSSKTANWNNASLQYSLNTSSSPYRNYSYVQSVTWKIGATTLSDAKASNGSINLYNGERSIASPALSPYTPTYSGIIGLPYMSDMLLATDGNSGATSRSTCINSETYVSSNQNWGTSTSPMKDCAEGSWLIKYANTNSINLWTLSVTTDYSNRVYYVPNSYEYGALNVAIGNNEYGVLPTIYLAPSLLCANCGDATAGTSTNPWILSANN